MSSDSPFLAKYQGKLDALKTLCETRFTASKGHGVKVFSSHVSEADALAVLLDRDLMLIRSGQHPAGENALLEVAHRSILLHMAQQAARELRAERLMREKEILDPLMQKAKEDIQAAEDKRIFSDLDQAIDQAIDPGIKARSKTKPSKKAPKGRGRGSKGRGKP